MWVLLRLGSFWAAMVGIPALFFGLTMCAATSPFIFPALVILTFLVRRFARERLQHKNADEKLVGDIAVSIFCSCCSNGQGRR